MRSTLNQVRLQRIQETKQAIHELDSSLELH